VPRNDGLASPIELAYVSLRLTEIVAATADNVFSSVMSTERKRKELMTIPGKARKDVALENHKRTSILVNSYNDSVSMDG